MELFTEADHLAEARYRKLLREQPGFVWRRFSDGEELMAYVFFPPGHRAEAAAPSVLFFHGGMWVGWPETIISLPSVNDSLREGGRFLVLRAFHFPADVQLLPLRKAAAVNRSRINPATEAAPVNSF